MPAPCREFIDGTAPHDGLNVVDKTSVFATTISNVKANGFGIVTIGSATVCSDIAITGSLSVRVNGKYVHRVGDVILTHEDEPSVSVSGAPLGTVNIGS